MTYKVDLLGVALSEAVLIRFRNKYDSTVVDAYVLDIGRQFVLLGLVNESMRFDGFQCLHPSAITRLKVPCPFAEFIVEALRKRNELIQHKPDVDLDALPELLSSANRLFPLVTVHRQKSKPNECRIGKVVDVTKKHLHLLQIDPRAVWHQKPSKFRLTGIDRVDFGGGYEEALYLVGGEPAKMQEKPVIN